MLAYVRSIRWFLSLCPHIIWPDIRNHVMAHENSVKKIGFWTPVALPIVGMLVFFFSLPGCSNLHFRGQLAEGTITYKVSYPYYDGFMAGMLPDKMKMKFKNNRYTNELSSGNYFRTSFTADCENKQLNHELKFLNKQWVAHLNEETIPDVISNFPPFTIIQTGETDSIAGCLCQKAIAVFDDILLKDMPLYYTTDIDIKDFNWCNPFAELEGVLLAYEVEKFGLRTRFRAISVQPEKIDDTAFASKKNYNEISSREMHLKMQDIFKDVLY